ncbi:MAG: HK97 family phage prohead protease [Spirochaetales bacterium]|nr:HK97 family phage prohead protease [Spirochaetales bacterium]
MDAMQKRSLPCEFRTEKQEDGKMHAEGVAILYEETTVLYEDANYRYEEVIAQGAASESLVEDDVRAVWNHNYDIVLGRQSAKTLSLEEKEDGVHVDIDFPDSQEGRDKFTSVERGDVSQMSFGFDILKETVTEDNSGEKRIVRSRVEKVKLYEVSPVTFPAYENTKLNARDRVNTLREKAAALTSTEDHESDVRSREIEIMKLRSESWKN